MSAIAPTSPEPEASNPVSARPTAERVPRLKAAAQNAVVTACAAVAQISSW
ncbi:MAG TPA: hypothetical protein VGE27_14675 [Gemmatimonas sp.]|uniref:hypothetical protein n=1 Tax=Gemmatimonas sp. TaxID=1962908 RepID=UPI002EDB356C